MGTEGPPVLDRSVQGLPPLDSGLLSGSASCTLPPRREAVGKAREFTRSVLGGWRLAGDLDGVVLVVSELVTNALRHGLAAADVHDPDPPIRLHLMHWSGRLVCAVRDPSRRAPVAGGPDFAVQEHPGAPDGSGAVEPAGCGRPLASAAESGRGLFLVRSFSDRWGWQPVDGPPSGKVVWALFRLDSGRVGGVTP